MRVVFDIEASSLLDDTAIDYTQSPYKLKDTFTIHCIVCMDIDTGKLYRFLNSELDAFVAFSKGVTNWISHNGLGFDHLALKLALGLDYSIYPMMFDGRECKIDDTFVMSETLYPDRDGHSLEYYGQLFGFNKIDWRSDAVELGLISNHDFKGAEFLQFHPKMVDYCQRDVELTAKVYQYLLKEWGEWKWDDAYTLELEVYDIINRQAHRGFLFDIELAEKCVKDLDSKMSEIESRVTLPDKPATKGTLTSYTPPKLQFKKDGTLSNNMLKFIERVGARLESNKLIWRDKEYALPLPKEPLLTAVPTTMADTTFIKGYLITEYGWEPTSWKEKDLTLDSSKKKLSKEAYLRTVDRYIEQTLNTGFKKHRLKFLKVKEVELEAKLKLHDIKKPMKVITTPDFTMVNKELCKGLEAISKQFPFAQDIATYLTYRHRRNSIIGSSNEIGDEGIDKGYISYVRPDSRVPTSADTCKASTRRMLHRKIANIPRVTSLYGTEMRSLFTVDSNYYLIGADFASLEAMTEANRVFSYEGGVEYGESLTKEKPNSVHCNNARKLGISRSDAKTLKYACSYGAQPKKIAKSLNWDIKHAEKVFHGFWEEAKPLKLLIDRLERYWKSTDKKFILGLDGSKIWTRSPHALLNSLLQSDGAICAKRQLVLFDRKLKDAGLSCDFFKDDWRNKAYAQQLIAYHDEIQVEVSKSLVKWKAFATKEDAVQFRNESTYALSEVVEKDGRFYIGYSIVGQFISDAAKETSDYYKMNVELKMDYAIGRNWAETH